MRHSKSSSSLSSRPCIVRRTSVGPLVTVAVAALVAAVLPAAAARGGAAAMESEDTAAYEVAYLKFTAEHHLMGVAMAELGLEKAESTLLEDLSVRIREDQAEEIGQVQGFLSAWYGESYTPTLGVTDEEGLQSLGDLNGTAFDLALSETFVMHHQMMIDISEEAAALVEHEELRAFARNVIDVQTAEIAEFEFVIAGATPIPLPAPVVMGAAGMAVAGLAARRMRRGEARAGAQR